MNTLIKLQVVLAVVGLGISSYLLSTKWFNMDLVCGISTCGIVNSSKYAVFLWLPISAWGILFYLFVAGLGLTMKYFSNKILYFNFVLALIGFLFSLYLTYLEAFVIKAWCQWCVASAWISFCYFVVALRLCLKKKSANI